MIIVEKKKQNPKQQRRLKKTSTGKLKRFLDFRMITNKIKTQQLQIAQKVKKLHKDWTASQKNKQSLPYETPATTTQILQVTSASQLQVQLTHRVHDQCTT